MKNIILLDSTAKYALKILKDSNIHVKTFVGYESVRGMIQPYIDKGAVDEFFSNVEIDHVSVLKMDALSHETVEEARPVQQKVETAMRRLISDYNEIKYNYYCALAFWNTRLKDIDCIVTTATVHGLLYDGVPMYLAKLRGIPAYSVEPLLGGGFCSIFSHVENHSIKIIKSGNHNKISVEGVLNKTKNSLRGLQFHDRYKDGKMKKLYPLYRFLGAYKMDILISIATGTVKKKRSTGGSGFNYSLLDIHKSWKYYRKLRKALDEVEEDFHSEPGKHYILYYLQLEPEGNNCNAVIDSRCYQVKLLADSLPSNWELLVKEHPHQFRLEDDSMYYLLPFIENFKSKRYYEIIKSHKNVRLIKRSISTAELLSKVDIIASEKGSVLFEAVQYHKQILTLDRTNPISEYSGCFIANDKEEIAYMFENMNNGYIPDYRNIDEFIDCYVTDSSHEVVDTLIYMITK